MLYCIQNVYCTYGELTHLTTKNVITNSMVLDEILKQQWRFDVLFLSLLVMVGVLVITLGRIVRFPSGCREDVLVPFIPAEEVQQ